MTCARTGVCIAWAVCSAARAADWTSLMRPESLMQTPGASLSSVCRICTLAHFSMASSTTIAGDHPPISTKASASDCGGAEVTRGPRRFGREKPHDRREGPRRSWGTQLRSQQAPIFHLVEDLVDHLL